MAQRISKVLRLTVAAGRKCISNPAEAYMLLRMAWWVTVLSVAAKLCPLPRALKLVSGEVTNDPDYHDPDLPLRLARSIDSLLSADIFYFKPICWKRAAVLRRYLGKTGVTTKILFGVRNEAEGKVAGHAWLEANGQPFLESSPPEYVVTYTYPSNQPFRVDDSRTFSE
ncbi:MAG TPA: lasso peptide biosynthesis B2 protein [Pyrinomonadaceae bacterium]|nr:lasso peptide biosynthesis B2 protein [Pyrinomonadaceae bacterium]